MNVPRFGTSDSSHVFDLDGHINYLGYLAMILQSTHSTPPVLPIHFRLVTMFSVQVIIASLLAAVVLANPVLGVVESRTADCTTIFSGILAADVSG